MEYNNANIFFRQKEYDEVMKLNDNTANQIYREATNYFKNVDDWESLRLLILSSNDYGESYASILSSKLNMGTQGFDHIFVASCGTKMYRPDEIYTFSIFNPQPLFYLALIFLVIFIISLFRKNKIFTKLSFAVTVILIFGNMYNYFVIEKDQVEDAKKAGMTENCRKDIYLQKFDEKCKELSKFSSYPIIEN